MGTSGSYGGASGRPWNAAADALNAFLGGDGEASSADGDGSSADGNGDGAGNDQGSGRNPPARPSPDQFIRGVGRALRRGDPSLRGAGRGGGSSGDGGGGGGRRGRREVGRRAASAGRAIAGAYAIRSGDAAALRDLGLDLADFGGLRPVEQKQRLLDEFLGRPNHPDDAAVRRAADGFLERILTAEVEPDPAAVVREFAGALIFQMAVVPLTEGLQEKRLSRRDAERAEKALKDWLDARLPGVDLGVRGESIDLSTLAATTQTLTAVAVDMMCKTGS
ncbi:MAG: hypothetical protein IT200_16120 [Thermoleophilia bacterium]|nr:hypothetical protein [Thermoleophilia bacterium]